MFKKTLLASAIMGMAAAANATPSFENEVGLADLSATYSTQGALSATAIETGQIFVNFGVEYRVGDEITVTFSEDFAAGTDLDFLVGSTTHDLFDGLGTAPANKVGEITLGLLESTANSFTLRVTSIQETGPAVGVTKTKNAKINLTQNGNFPLDGAAVRAANGATMTYSARAAVIGDTGPSLDGGPVSGLQVIDFTDQFASIVLGTFDAEIDVEQQDGNRDTDEVDYFAGGLFPSYYAGTFVDTVTINGTTLSGDLDDNNLDNETANIASTTFDIDQNEFMSLQQMTASGTRTTFVGVDSDFFNLQVTDALPGATDGDVDTDSTDAELVEYTVTISGNFGSLNGGDIDVTVVNGAIASESFDAAAQTFTYVITGDGSALYTSEVEISQDGSKLEESVFTVQVDVTYGDAGDDHDGLVDVAEHTDTEIAAGTDAGMWEYNGTTVTLYAVPWSAGVIDQFIWLTNSGVDTAEVTASVTYNDGTAGGAVTTVNLGKITDAAPGLTNVGIALGDALEALSNNGRGTITLVTSTDRSLVNVDASYKHIDDKDRLRIETSQTLNERSVESSKAKD